MFETRLTFLLAILIAALGSAIGVGIAALALRPGGILAIWSAAPDARFTKRLAAAGFRVEEVGVRARAGGKGARHVIWFARAG